MEVRFLWVLSNKYKYSIVIDESYIVYCLLFRSGHPPRIDSCMVLEKAAKAAISGSHTIFGACFTADYDIILCHRTSSLQ